MLCPNSHYLRNAGHTFLGPCPHDTFPTRSLSIANSSRPVARVQPESSFRFLETTSRPKNGGREPFAIGRVRSTLSCGRSTGRWRPLAKSLPVSPRLLIYFLPFIAHVRFHTCSLDYSKSNMTLWSKADTRTLISIIQN